MGTKRPGCTLFDTPSNINTSDRKLHPGGKISRDPSPRPAMTAQSEQEIDKREDDWRREREMERMREKTRHRDMELREQYYERDRAPAPRPREGDREGSRDRRQQDRRIHVRSYVEKDTEREEERGTNKGDTFPRMRKSSAESARRRPELDEDRGERRPKRVETDYERRDRDRDGQRKSRPREEGTNTGRRPAEDKKSQQVQRYRSDVGFQDRRREVHSDPRVRRERSAAREREKPRSNMEKWETRRPSPHRRQDREIYLDRSERGKAQREGKRNSRSEGDSDEREQRRERARSRERDRAYHQSRSEGDNMDKMEADRSRRKGVRKEYTGRSHDRREDERNREYSKQRRDRETTDRKTYSRWDDTTGRSSQAQRETAPRVQPRVQSSGEWSSDMDSEVRYRRRRDSYEETGSGRESTTHRERDVKEQRNPERAAERNPAREPTRTERHERERKEVQDAERRGSVPEQKKMWLDPQRGRTSRDEYVDRGRHTSGDERSVVERGRGEPDERYRGRHGERNQYRGDTERETEGVSVDGDDVGEDERGKKHPSDSGGEIEGSQRRDAEGDKVTDNTDESDREEEGGRDSWGRSESEGGSGKPGEDGFETVSSGWDEEDEREEAFEDCQEFFEGEVACNGPSSVALEGEEGAMGEEEMVEEKEEGRGSKKKYVFCVIGTLPQQKTNEVMPQQIDQTKGAEIENPYLESLHHSSDSTQQPQDALHVTLSGNDEFPIINNQDTKSRSYLNSPREERAAIGESTEVNMRYRVSPELQNTDTGVGMRSKSERPYTPIETVKRDSQTERLLNKWRENNKEEVEQDPEVPSNPYGEVLSQVNFEQIQPILDGLASGAMSPEEVEAIRIRMSGAWSIAEEPKRHSQAPHLKWAKNVVREILGRSEDKDLDEPKTEVEGNRGVSQSEAAMEKDPQQEEEEEEGAQGTGEMPGVRLSTDEEPSEPEPEEEESLEVEGSRGMRQKQAEMHADQCTAMHGDTCTYTNTDTLLDTEGEECPSMDKQTESSGLVKVEKADDRVELSETEKEAMENREMEMYLSLSSTLYKPNSCPILNYDSDSDLLVPSREDEDQEGGDRMGESEEERQGEEHGDSGSAEEVGEVTQLDGTEAAERKTVGGDLKSSYSFRDLGPEARFRRRGIRKTTERRKGELVEVEEEMEDVGRDRRTRIFSTTDDEDDKSKSWGEVDLRNVLDTIERRKRNSRFFNAAQLYQQYSEAAQNFEIQRQARSDVVSIIEDAPRSPLTSPKPARRPLPPLPPVQHPHSLSHTHSITSVKSLPVPETGRRPSSPRLSACLTQSSTLWRELPGVRNSLELEELTEDQRRLQEVRFEVVTSEASYCRSLDIVVEHFVKSKQLGALLTTQDRNWLFSRLADVRAISHSFLSKLEERVESDMMQFTVCDIITRHCQRFKMVYVPYLTNQSYQDATYQRLMIENSGFKRIVDKLERSPVCQRLPLRSFLVLPFQRITRIKLLVQNIVKRTTPGTMEATHAIKSLKLLEKLIQESNDSITQMKSIESLVSLSAKVDFECRTLPLISQSRRLVREGPVSELMDFSLKDTERHIYLHLFNDYLLLSLQKDGGRFTVIDHSPVSDLRAENCRVKLHSLQKNLFRLHIAPKAKLLRTDTQSDKLRWISALSRPHPEIDYSAAQDFPQMQCIRAVVAQQSDELSLDKADIILVHQQSSDHWVEGTKLSDRHRGWVPESHLETISNSRVRERNLSDALKLTTAKAAV